METITTSDLKIILASAFQMAGRDNKLEEQEKGLIKKIIKAGRISNEQLTEIKQRQATDAISISKELSSNKAKRAFLLTLAAVALSDGIMDGAEKEMLDRLSKHLNVGMVDLNSRTYEDCEAMVLKTIAEAVQ